jgi:hypothetical protein
MAERKGTPTGDYRGSQSHKRSYDQNQGCQIESNRISLSNRKFLLISNRMQIESNEIFDFRYDSIRSGQKGEQDHELR